MPPQRSKTDILIIGGGASGLAACHMALSQGRRVTLLERQDKCLRKLLATGNGRCNLFNVGAPAYFHGEKLASSVLSQVDVDSVAHFFQSLGLLTKVEEEGRAYPLCDSAAAVADTLLWPVLNSRDCELVTGCEVSRLTYRDGLYTATDTTGQAFVAPRVILAMGSCAAPQLGGNDSPYRLAEGLGLPVVHPLPALSALTTSKTAVKGLSGQRTAAVLTLMVDGQTVDKVAGELLFFDDGLSGLCAMQLGGTAAEALALGRQVTVSVDLSPQLGLSPRQMRRLPLTVNASPDVLKRALLSRLDSLPEDRLLNGLLPPRLIGQFVGLSVDKLAIKLVDWRFRITGVRGFDKAQVARGGVDTAVIDPRTLQVKNYPGLYVTGEMLDVDGDTGGFNLLFAFASGLIAGQDAATRAL